MRLLREDLVLLDVADDGSPLFGWRSVWLNTDTGITEYRPLPFFRRAKDVWLPPTPWWRTRK